MKKQKYSSKTESIPEMITLLISLMKEEGLTQSALQDNHTTWQVVLISYVGGQHQKVVYFKPDAEPEARN